MGFLKNVLKGATTLNPKKSAKHFVGSLVDPAGTTIREGRGQSSLPTNAKGYYDPAGITTPQVIGAPPTRATPMAQPELPPLGQKAQKAPPLPGVTMSSPKSAPTMQAVVNQAVAAQAPGASRSFKTSAPPAYTPAIARAAAPAPAAAARPVAVAAPPSTMARR